MTLRQALSCLLLLCVALRVTAAPLPALDAAGVEKLLAPDARSTLRAPVVTGDFTQKKQLQDLPMPLLSSGRFVLASGTGIDWQGQKPFASDFILTSNALIESSGGTVHRTDNVQQPALAAVSKLLLALFAVDVKALDAEFRFAGVRTGNSWQLQLLPRHAALAAAFAEAKIEGDSQLRRVVLTDGRGDITEISFSGVHTQARLTPEQQARFK